MPCNTEGKRRSHYHSKWQQTRHKRQSKLTAEAAAKAKANLGTKVWAKAKGANTELQAQGQDFTNWRDLGNWQKQTACLLDALAQEYHCKVETLLPEAIRSQHNKIQVLDSS